MYENMRLIAVYNKTATQNVVNGMLELGMVPFYIIKDDAIKQQVDEFMSPGQPSVLLIIAIHYEKTGVN